MTTESDADARDARLAEIARRVQNAFPELAERALAREYVDQYFLHVGTDDLTATSVDSQVGLVAEHLLLGLDRQPDETKLAIYTPTVAEDGWTADGATVIQAVIPDRRFIVDTFIITVPGLGWTIREVFHPQFGTDRDESGHFADFVPLRTPAAAKESWICLEVTPGAGSDADTAEALREPLLRALNLGAAAVADYPQMLAHMEREVEGLAELPPGPEITFATELLTWLAAENFVFLGYREFTFDGEFHPVPGTGLGISRGDNPPPDTFHAYPDDDPLALVITKDTHLAPVHRRAYMDYIGVRRFDEEGRVTGEARFLGLFAATAYIESVYRIPGLSTRAAELLSMSSFAPDAHGRSLLQRAIATYPRNELFQATAAELFDTLEQVSLMQERRQVRVFLRPSVYEQFVSVAVYLPRDRYVTSVRYEIQRILLAELGGLALDHQVHLTESIMARLFFVVRVPDTKLAQALDIDALEAQIDEACRNWDDEFAMAAGDRRAAELGVEFPESYQADYTAAQAVLDLAHLERLRGPDDLEFALCGADAGDGTDCRLKVFAEQPMSLATAMPHLAALGVAVVDERPHEVTLRGRPLRVYDFGLQIPGGSQAFADWTGADRRRFIEAFEASYRGWTEVDALNELVVSGRLTWEQISWLRTLSRYLLQADAPYSQSYIAAALCAQVGLAVQLVARFAAMFDPDTYRDPAERTEAVASLRADFLAGVDEVASLDHDRILRLFDKVLAATVRTNAFASAPALALKLLPQQIDFLPEPRPEYEIFVHSPRVSGTHLRFGKIARGGLRWSDRVEDFRTEVLGLVKAQVVKNAVIVPSGAKGGFVPLLLPSTTAGREAVQAEGVAAYKIFIRSLLSVTDNIVAGRTVTPDRVVTLDGPDPYLVVAADKGTASFSDIANEISVSHGFWLGDAFASGGSAGYDHKGMGITARGAWESVRQHFAEMGVDCQTTDFTAVGIGDMAGDVFGNGMLRSRHTRLVAAFNHQHIFIDPDPDAAAGFEERNRLFETPRSTWADYNPDLISPGGGVYVRTDKAITLSPEAKRALGIDADVRTMTPAEVISAVLCAPVDLLFNGGIGTYVKATAETHAEVGDRANDAVRVDGSQLRARCVGEGGNLGFTQLGRIEYALSGGRINTDFIDNSAGVDTSDHEVNIKILLAPEVASGRLSEPERRELLASMTDEVARLVLAHNYDQNLALANSMWRRVVLAGQHESWMRTLEADGLLDRGIEALPTSEEMAARIAAGDGLSRPELSVLLSYTKIALDRWVLASDLPDDPYLADRLVQYFPEPLRARYADRMPGHRLAREIVATVAVNRFVNSQGITCYHRLSTETGAGVADIIRAQLASRAIFAVGLDEVRLRRSTGLDAAVATELRVGLRRMVERATRWLLHHQHGPLDVAGAVARYGPEVAALRTELGGLLRGQQATAAELARTRWTDAGLTPELAANLATAGQAHTLLSVVDVAQRLQVPAPRVAAVHYLLAEATGIDELVAGVDGLPRQVRWDAMARAALRDELLAAHAALTAQVLVAGDPDAPADRAVADWLAADPARRSRVATIHQLADGTADVARMNVGLSQVRQMLA